jgi:hypothetical protein
MSSGDLDVGWEGLGFVVVDALVGQWYKIPKKRLARCRAAAG